ncbi:MAG: hypothetical protein HRU38_22085 [Saccharospirillaceae bacterium]|nr:hypothetical protein [Pseudomonadales bacterium]NRB81319.1 hypothetical protein [Saccharospirillaceae bacterium]
MNFTFRRSTLLFCLTVISTFSLADILIQVDDNINEGFNDPTFGQARLQVFEQAAAMLSTYIESQIDIIVLARFDELTCTNQSATLGSASPLSTAYNFPNAPYEDTLYPIALANAIAQEDLEPNKEDIIAVFNSNLDSGNCLGGSTWYYQFDEAPDDQVSLLEVVLHELIHGLGFISTVAEDGSRLFYQWIDANGNIIETIYLDDPFMIHLVNGNGQNWGELDGIHDQSGNNIRRLDAISDDLFFSGPSTNLAILDKTDGISGGLVKMYTPSAYNSASNVSHFDTSVSPDEVMEPFNTGLSNGIGLAFEVLKDIGWPGINIPPVITGQQTITTLEDTAFTILYSDILVADPDTAYTSDFQLTIFSGENFDYINNQLVPDQDFNGVLYITVMLNDGKDNSNRFELSINVTAVNDAPEIINQVALNVNEDNSLLLTVGDFNIYDVEADNVQLMVIAGENYQFEANQITPNANFNGDLRVNVRATDGIDTGEVFEVSIAVIAQNDEPSFNIDSQYLGSINTEFSLLLDVIDVDNDPIQFSSNNTPIWLSFNANYLYGTPTADDLGVHTFNIYANDNHSIINKEITITVLENNQVDFSITALKQTLLTNINQNTQISYVITGSGQSKNETINIEFTSELLLTNDLCTAINNGLSCQYSLMNSSDTFFINTNALQLGSYKIQASIIGLPAGVIDTNLTNQNNEIWLSVIESDIPILSSTQDHNFESNITSITSDKLSNRITLGFADQHNQLLSTNQTGQYAVIAQFAADHNTNNIDLMDVNNDGTVDIISTSFNQSAQVYLSINNEFELSETFSQMPIDNITQSAVIDSQTYAIADNDTLYILKSNMLDSFTTINQISLSNISNIQLSDINKDEINDLIITFSDTALSSDSDNNDTDSFVIIFKGSAEENTLFETTAASFPLTNSTKIHAAIFEQNPYLLQGHSTGFNILSFNNNSLSQIQSFNTGQVKDISSINDKGVFYVLNESGSIFIYHFENNTATLLSASHISFVDKLLDLPIDSEQFALWTTNDKTLSLITVVLPITELTSAEPITQTNTSTETQTDTNTQSGTDNTTDVSTPISNTADDNNENMKLGQINYSWLILLFALVLVLRNLGRFSHNKKIN